MRKKWRKGLLITALLLSVMLIFAGCEDPISALTGESTGEGSGGEVVELADTTPIPANGVITEAQFRSIAGKDRAVTFTGESMDGIKYEWTFNGKGIQNPVDQNLKVDFIKDGDSLNAVKAAAGNAEYGIGINLTGSKGLVAVPQLTITLPEKWDADTAVLCKQNGDSVAKMSNAVFDNESETTKLTVNIIETGGDYYIVGGKTIAPEPGTTAGSGDAGGEVADQSGGSENTCTISINCSTLLANMGNLTPGKEEFVPSDGWILKPVKVSFNEGESVHDVLQRVCRENGIQMESSWTPAYSSAYVEGINQLYEFDGGELSGWMYNVNGWFPNYGCSKYTVANGDVINWVYTCDLGKDVGDNSMW